MADSSTSAEDESPEASNSSGSSSGKYKHSHASDGGGKKDNMRLNLSILDPSQNNGKKQGKVKHVRIYYDKSQPDLGYQLLFPAKPKLLIEMEKREKALGDTSAYSESLGFHAMYGSGSVTTLRYVWSSHTTFIVDFINQLLGKSFVGKGKSLEPFMFHMRIHWAFF